jgi:UDP-3-O-[3-hydroxymyristoyl] glucosamine N-acyltransferase
MVAAVANSRPLTVADIASLTGAVPREGTELSHCIAQIAPIDEAGPADLTFLENVKFAEALATTRAGAVLTAERFARTAPKGLNLLLSPEPYRAFVAVAREIYRGRLRPASPYESCGVAPGASVHPSAELGAGVTVDPGAVVGPRAVIGAGTIIGANAVIGADVRIGRDCSIGPSSTIIDSVLGDRVIIHPGCHIGQDGFGFLPDAALTKIPQIGRVVIHDDVEIGAGTTIDRGGMRDTVIGQGTKIDNLVQIGHNVTIGRHCIIVAQSGLSGSVTLEDRVVLAARVGIVPHVTVHEGAHLAARSTVRRDVPRRGRWGGNLNAKPIMQAMRELIAIERLVGPGERAESPPLASDAPDKAR